MRLPSSNCLNPQRYDAFTLIELLTVVAIIGILAAIIVPTAGGARNAAKKAKTRAQFSAWGAAFESFRQEYGSYPQLYPQGAQKLVNQGAAGNPTGAATHHFHDLLAGVRRDGSALTGVTTGTPTPRWAKTSGGSGSFPSPIRISSRRPMSPRATQPTFSLT